MNPVAVMETSMGTIKIELLKDIAPKTVDNFIGLAEGTKEFTDPKNGEKVKRPYYDGLIFHRVIEGFMAQGGCPDGTGMGGPDWAIECETDAPKQVHKKGSLSMAHAGPNTGGSQFFICFAPQPHLDGGHTVFGEIEEDDEDSFEVLDSIRQEDTIDSIEILEKKN